MYFFIPFTRYFPILIKDFLQFPDEVDVIGYTSNQSDSESLVSGHSGDSGVGVGARRRPRTPLKSRVANVPRTRRAARLTKLV